MAREPHPSISRRRPNQSSRDPIALALVLHDKDRTTFPGLLEAAVAGEVGNPAVACRASDGQILVQFLLEALVLACLGALAGTFAGAGLCRSLSHVFPYGPVVNPVGLAIAWFVALALALVFGLYPALRAARLSPIGSMR